MISKRVRKWSIIFFTLLIALTLFSKTFMHWLTPKVKTSDVTNGSINMVSRILEWEVLSTQMVSYKVDDSLAGVFHVRLASQTKPRYVKQGDTLIAFSALEIDAEEVKRNYAYVNDLTSLRSFDRTYEDVKQLAQKEMDRSRSAMDKYKGTKEDRKAELQKAYTNALLDYNQIAIEGIHMGTTRDILQTQLALSQKAYECVKEIREVGYVWRSPVDGLVVNQALLGAEGLLAGNTVLIQILPINANYNICVKLENGSVKDETLQSDSHYVSLVNRTNAMEVYEGETIQLDAQNEEGEITIALNLQSLDLIERLSEFDVMFRSPFYSALVPNGAFIDENTVLCIKTDYKNGKKTNVVVPTKVITAPGNEQYTPILHGIGYGTQVVTGWDRYLKAGVEVIILP